MHKPITRKFRKWKVYSSFKDNIWGVDLACMQLISEFNEGFRFLLCVTDMRVISKCVISVNARGLFLWKIKKGIKITNAF